MAVLPAVICILSSRPLRISTDNDILKGRLDESRFDDKTVIEMDWQIAFSNL